MPIEGFAPHRHLELIERILHDIVGVQLVDLFHDNVDIGHERVGEEQELRPRQRLKAGEAELVGFEAFEACRGEAGVRVGGCGGGGCCWC